MNLVACRPQSVLSQRPIRRSPNKTYIDSELQTIKAIFAGRQFKVAVATTPSQPSDHTSSTNCSIQKSSDLAALLERLRVLRQRLNENKKSLVADQLVQQTDVFNRYATVDRPPDQRPPPPHSSGRRYKHRQRYAIKTRSQVVKHEPPEAMKQNQWKPYKSAPDSPLEPQSAVSSSKPKSPKRLPSAEGMDKKDLVNAMARDHPMRTLDIGTVNANATRGLNREFGPEGSSVYLPRVKIALRDIAHQSSHVKRVCQRAIGLYLERLALSINESVVPALPMVMDVVGTIESVQPLQQQPLQQQPLQKQASKLHAEDRLILDKLCPKFTAKDIADGRNINDGTTEDLTKPDDSEHDETLDKKNEPLQYLMCLLNAMYSGKLPKRQKGKEKGGAPSIDSPSAVCTFIERARDFLPAITKDGDGLERDFAGSSFLRSTALQLSVELKKHYRNGSTDLCEKIALLKTKKLLPLEARDCVDPDITAFENFVLLNRVCGCPRSLVPMSSFENKFITVSELELTRIFWRDPMLKTVLQSYAWPDFPSIEYADQVSQTDVGMWLSRAVPGCLITKLLTDIGGYSEVERKKLRSYSRSTRLMPLEDTRRHIQQIRHADFQPTSYTDKGYVLHGSIRTDGFRLQLIAFKMNELHSVKYRQLPADRLPNRLTSTVAGTDYFLTEIRNVVSTPQDVVDLWGCDPKRIKILGIDLGQAFVVGASALLPSRNKHLDAEGGPEGAQKDPLVKQPTTKYFNLAVKQKAVYQPTLKHRRWLEQRKAQPLEGGGSICQIETSLPARFGPDASIAEYTTRMQEVEAQLGSFYGSVVLKKHRWNARKARDEEYRLIANRLLEMVGGSLGAKRKESNKIVIGVGLGQFSSRIRLLSLHESFESYFIQKARSLGYIVVGVNEYYTSKKCPTCGEFVGQVDLRRLYYSECKKYMHRDVMAGHNICNVIRGHLLKQERPRYLQPKDIDGNYPWEEKQSFRPRPGGSGAGGHKGKGVKRKATDEGTDSSQFRRVSV
ncbi:hypothetical protein KI688_007847 [Linnemannia hyalina]|uniref:Cas12f1-like TNB domain-containing protein n=1 Tax=Linnemannia hyalina TaxID=64524 RepID=A0A9P7XGW4_9FUNG|nr:hypothetical protein KI688_007847 [Linnemannia hyalina]